MNEYRACIGSLTASKNGKISFLKASYYLKMDIIAT